MKGQVQIRLSSSDLEWRRRREGGREARVVSERLMSSLRVDREVGRSRGGGGGVEMVEL